MAFWGAPVPSERHAIDACAAALRSQRLLASQRAAAEHCGGTPLRVRVGINTGRMLVGNIGSSERLNYTVIGDPVNLASRLEGLNRVYSTSIIVGHATYEAAKYEFVFRRLDTVTVRGRDEPVRIYELLAESAGAADDEAFAWVKLFERGLASFEEQDWQAAAEL